MKRLATALLFIALAPSVRAQSPLRLVLVERNGSMQQVGTLPAATFSLRAAPDGRRIVYDAGGAVWVAALDNLAVPRRVASGAYPIWSGDGSQVLFIDVRGGRQQLFRMPSDGTGTPEMIVDDARAPESWSSAAQVISYITLKDGADYDVQIYSLRDQTHHALAALPGSNQSGSRLSPNGRWIAYESNDSGEWAVYVEPFPSTGSRTSAAAGGRRPIWSADGGELFFDQQDSRLYVVSFQAEPRVRIGAPMELPINGFVQGTARRQYDLLPDGTRFLMLFR